MKAREPEKTQILAELYRKIAPAGIAELRIGAAAEDFANLLRAKHHEAIDHVTLDEVHAQYRRAGEAFECAAKMRPDAERTEMLRAAPMLPFGEGCETGPGGPPGICQAGGQGTPFGRGVV